MKKSLLSVTIAALTLAGCGSTPAERGVSGAGIGAGAGAVVGAITGLSVVEGAVIGATAGGLTGALTRKDQVNFGEPAWKQQANAQPSPPASSPRPVAASAADARTVRDIQSALARLGLYTGTVDGVAGQRTQSAIRAYQQRHGLLVDGRPSTELLAHIRQQRIADRDH